MPPHLALTQDSLRVLSRYANQLSMPGAGVGIASPELALLLLIAALPLVHFSMQYAMATLLLVYGPMQILRSIPYDIRVFILTHSRISLSILRLTNPPSLVECHSVRR